MTRAAHWRRHTPKPALDQFRGSVVEAVEAVLLTAADAVGGGDDDFYRNLFYRMTADQTETMENLRKAYLISGERLGPEVKALFLKITNICERLFWLLHNLAAAKESDQDEK